MSARHIPRLCRSCQAPMACKASACWRCGVRWSADPSEPSIGAAVIDARAKFLAGHDADRWVDEGGSLDRERPRLSPAVAGRR
jgi:hypothetical protein